MATKTIVIVLALACLIKTHSAQNLNALAEELLASSIMANKGVYGPLAGPYNPYGPPIGVPFGGPCGQASGGGFMVTSVSPIAPTGVSVNSENAVEGVILVTGELPFLGSIALEGVLPTAGMGVTDYGCGSGNVEITSEGPGPGLVGSAYGLGYAPSPVGGMYGPGYGYGVY